MRQLSKKSLISIACIVFGLFFSSVLFSISHVFALAGVDSPVDDEDSEIINISDSRHVTIFDGTKRLSIKSDAATVGEALSRAGFSLLDTDSVEPSLDSPINTDNFFINIHRSHPAFVIDAETGKNFYLMTSSFDPVTIAREAGFEVYDGDKVENIVNPAFLELGAVSSFRIVRGGGTTITLTEEIPYEEEINYDYSLAYGKSEVIRYGEIGEKVVKYQVFSVKGEEISRKLISEEITRESVARITRVGANTGSNTSPSENEAIAWDFLIGQGFSEVQTAGIMGNLAQEHGFSTSDSIGGLGIVQWTSGRRNNLLNKDNPYDIYTQLNYLMEELDGGYSSVKSAILEADSIEEATIIFQNRFERCGICREDARISFAYNIYERYKK